MSEKCIGCNIMTADLVCLLDGEEKDDIQLNMKQSDCELLADYRTNQHKVKEKVISFAAEVSAGDATYSASISHDKNKLILEFGANNVPFPIISKANFNVKIVIPEDRIDCINDCDTCMTPIC